MPQSTTEPAWQADTVKKPARNEPDHRVAQPGQIFVGPKWNFARASPHARFIILRMRTGIAALLVCSLGAGCAGQAKQTASTVPAFAGDARGPASVETLPSLDVPDSTLTAEMRMARLLSTESLELPQPNAPKDRHAGPLADWSDSELKRWLEEKQRRAEAAREALDRAAVQNQRQRIIAGALVGLVYEDIARTLLRVPEPAELASEPEVSAVFREVMLKQSAPFLVHAELAYKACEGNARVLKGMVHWSTFCHTRATLLPDNTVAEQVLQSQKTARR